jgi:hypothetical protein
MRTIFTVCLTAFALLSTNVWADNDDSFVSYDAIVDELRASADKPDRPEPTTHELNWEDVSLHAGVALNTSLVSFHLPDGVAGSGLFKGLQLIAGMNLFSRKLRAEGAYTMFQHEELDQNMKGDLKEVDLRLVYLPASSKDMTIRVGAGLAARYMDVKTIGARADTTYSAATPSSLLLVGLERRLTPAIAVGPDLSYRSSLVANTFDKSSWDASFRLNATF